MRILFLYGPPAVGKLTVAKELAVLSGLPVFHNHLVVDAVAAVFAFGNPEFVRLREKWWLDMFAAAAANGRSLIFTFQPEASVASDFPARVVECIAEYGGQVEFVRLIADDRTLEARINSRSRTRFGKLKSVELLRELLASFKACEEAMPAPTLTIATDEATPGEAARQIFAKLTPDISAS